MQDDDDIASPVAIGRRLYAARKVLDLTQTELAERAGISRTAYTQYEGGSKRPSIDVAISLVRTYRLTLDWIYLGDASNLPYALAAAIKALDEVDRT